MKSTKNSPLNIIEFELTKKVLSKMFIFFAFFLATCFQEGTFAASGINIEQIKKRVRKEGELAPLPEAKPLLMELAELLNSEEFSAQIKNSKSLEIMKKDLKASLFHLNFRFEVQNAEYPYEPPFEEPFPLRPTLTAMDEAIQFLEIVQATTNFQTALTDKLKHSSLFEVLKVKFPKIKNQGIPSAIPKSIIVNQPVDTYDRLARRIEKFGEIATFAEYEPDVEKVLETLQSQDYLKMRARDKAFDLACQQAIGELLSVKSLKGGEATRIQAEFRSPFPYRRTIEAIFKGLSVLDMFQRLTYPESQSWHEVEYSHYQGKEKKLLALYHFNRYKYQLAGLLNDPEIVLWPVSITLDEVDLFRLSAAPWGLLGVITEVKRGDRHFNTSKDFAYHDVNHVRRIWAYLKAKLKRLGAITRAQKLQVYKQHEKFINDMLEATQPVPGNERETEIRKVARMLFFETFHETARPPDKESMLYDLERKPGTRQPFELQRQTEVSDKEKLRTFDGNLDSGSNRLDLDLSRPTTVEYFWDRAPGYLANVDNKLRWGFYDSVFEVSNHIVDVRYRNPAFLAEAADRVYQLVGAKNPFTKQQMVQFINDRSGQSELWSYFDLHDSGLIDISGVDAFQKEIAELLHDNWRKTSNYQHRWLPADGRLANGDTVDTPKKLTQYLDELGVPLFLRIRYSIEIDSETKQRKLYEDIRNLPYRFLAPNHKIENMLAGAKGLSIVDRLWQSKLKGFSNPEEATRWLIVASQAVHQAVLDRNTNGVRKNPKLNVAWIDLPFENKLKDLEVVRIAFEARVEHDRKNWLKMPNKKKMPDTQILLIYEAIHQLRSMVSNDLLTKSRSFSSGPSCRSLF